MAMANPLRGEHASPRFICCLCVFLGIWLGFPNDIGNLPILVFLWPIGLAILGARSDSAHNAFCHGWLAQGCGSLAALYWLSFPVHYVGGLPWPAAFGCAILIAFLLATQGGLFALACFWGRCASPWLLAPFAGCIWYLLEYAFALAIGFPWLQLSGALAVWPIMTQGAELLGAWLWGAGWITGILSIIFYFPLIWGNYTEKKIHVSSAFCGATMLAFMLAYGWHGLRNAPYSPDPVGPDSMSALFVEGNIDQNQKWLPQFQRFSLNRYLELTEAGLEVAREKGMEHPLIIWPETALPFFFEKKPELARIARQCAIDSACPLLFGAPGVATMPGLPEEAVFNRAFLVGPGGNILGYYDKEHLVPFGEYLPQWLNFKFLESLLQGVGIYQEGSETAPLVYGPLALGMLICYEGIFPWIAEKRIRDGANILVDISNDGWFGHSPASRQHLYLTTLRCVEQNRWLLRGTNTGISAIADNRGRLTLTGPMFQAGYLAGSARLTYEKSIYQRIAPILPYVIMLFTIITGIRIGYKNRKPGHGSRSI